MRRTYSWQEQRRQGSQKPSSNLDNFQFSPSLFPSCSSSFKTLITLTSSRVHHTTPQHVWCGRTEIREEEMDPLFWSCDLYYLLCSSERIWSSVVRRKWTGEKPWTPPPHLSKKYRQSLSFGDTVKRSSQNRMAESLVLFESVINSRWFLRTSIILFLNKIDLFKAKLPKVPLERYFPEYTGGNDVNKAAKYILWRFTQLNRARLSIYPQ